MSKLMRNEERDESLKSGMNSHCRSVRFSVPFEYPVVFTRDCLSVENRCLVDAVVGGNTQRRHRLWFVLDAGLVHGRPHLIQQLEQYVEHHHAGLQLIDRPLVIPGGEECKNDPHVLQQLIEKLAEHHIDRHSYCVVLGGGAVLDVVGYAAATVHRGVRLLRLPTTVLSQNDAGVGVKNGVNAFGQKNFLGTFSPPRAVINDSLFLETLSLRDRRAGIAEAVKVALIRDGDFFDWLCEASGALSRFERQATETMIRRGAELHLDHIMLGGDPFEMGSARPLDFGHWAAHKLEGLTKHRLRHGEAVAIGVALDTLYSSHQGWIAASEAERVLSLLDSLGLPCYHEALHLRDAQGRLLIEQGLTEFREHLGGELSVTFLNGIGIGQTVHEVDLAIVDRCVNSLRSRATATLGAGAGV